MLCPLHSSQLYVPSGFCISAGFAPDGQVTTVPTGMLLVALAVICTFVGSKDVASAARDGREQKARDSGRATLAQTIFFFIVFSFGVMAAHSAAPAKSRKNSCYPA